MSDLLTTPDTDLSYAELQQKRALEWSAAQTALASKQTAQATALASAPDVLATPNPASSWSFPGIVCPTDQGTDFYVSKWVTVTGVKHRFVGRCASCLTERTWDWDTMDWIA